ncbi:MAG: alpha/beta hydrolase, partial [Pseudomonadota bacterium]
PDERRWLTTSDGKRLRAVAWGQARRGTVVFFQGRAEFVEKYAAPAERLVAKGFRVVAFDWRGQGLSDRPKRNRQVGHVRRFAEFQLDLAAVEEMIPPGRRILFAHSMGGAIGLRALHRGWDAQAALFTAPMWGIHLVRFAPAIRALAHFSVRIGFGGRMIPGGTNRPFATVAPYLGNVLTSDADAYAWLQNTLRETPALGLGAPSLGWVSASLTETAALRALGPPPHPHLVFLGTDEAVVATDAIHALTNSETLVSLPGARHEPLIETPEIRDQLWQRVDAFLDQQVP